ncbi:MAG: N-acetyltransferase [Deltaproteobacteria bacterium]|nr:N-acetyltransferase [Deltaproteobacteria bacterium]
MNASQINIRPLGQSDWPIVAEIYLEGIKTCHATFEQEVSTWEIWDKGHLKKCRLVAEKEGQITGWAALSPVSERCVYAGVCEVSVYVATVVRGKGIGHLLLNALIGASEIEGIWTIQAGIFPENKTSLALHKACGFREIGIREKIGKMDGCWRDVVLLERRSKTIGIC